MKRTLLLFCISVYSICVYCETIFSIDGIAIPNEKELIENAKVSGRVLNKLSDKQIKELKPIFFIDVRPDSLTNYKMKAKASEMTFWSARDSINYMWNLTGSKRGFTHDASYRLKDRLKYSSVPSVHIDYSINIFPNEQLFFPYLCKTENDSVLIFDLYGNRYNSVEDLILSKFGSFDTYKLLYYMLYQKNIIVQRLTEIANGKPTICYMIDYNIDSRFIVFWNTKFNELQLMSLDKFYAKYKIE